MPREKKLGVEIRKEIEDGAEASCNICGAMVYYHGSPSTMANNLKSVHQLKADNSNERYTYILHFTSIILCSHPLKRCHLIEK